MFDNFTHIINGLKALRKTYPNKEMVKKMLNSLPTYWEPKVMAIEESKDLNSLFFDELIGSLLTYEMKINYKEKEIKKVPRKVGVAFKSITCENDEDSSKNDDDEEMKMFAKRFKRSRSSQYNEDQEVVNLYLMAIDDIKVTSNSSTLNDYSFDELQDAYDELGLEFDFMISKHKKNVSKLRNENGLLSKTNHELEEKVNKMQEIINDFGKKNLDLHNLLSKAHEDY
ncbi:UBN2 domain-containing protein [Gossypium australe]|uniref:UBN2 domain-containing protein n=1 Tax=Gossypium australe TaxID=47621 RepID=A0A5B6VZC7_9ROSI|nr:UBN2 domain-containing protein [Gossypium australe]